MIIFILLALGLLAYVLHNPKLLGGIVAFSLIAISFLTPFWPVILIGLFFTAKLGAEENKKKEK